MALPTEEIAERARRIRLLLADCDGVLTNGRLYVSTSGGLTTETVKVFHIHDGQGMRLAVQAGLVLGIISGRSSSALAERAREMHVRHLYQGVSNKLEIYERIKAEEQLKDKQIAYIGDDLPDLPPMRRSGLSIAVADAVAEISECAHLVTSKRGGRGAVREAIELLLRAQEKWDELVAQFKS